MKTIVFDIGGTSVKCGTCTDHTLSDLSSFPTNAYLGGPYIIDQVISFIKKHSDFDAIGISTAGQVNAEEGSIIYANSNIPNYTGMQIKKELETLFHVPITVENDVNCAALGESIYGSGKNYNDFLCLTYGTGVGGAIIQNNKIYHGSSFSAGEFGGIITHGSANLSAQNQDVFCGCYERYASTSALVRTLSAYDTSLVNGKLIFENLNRSEVKSFVDQWIDEILLGLATIIHIFNPSCIVLGGGIMAQSYIIEEIRKRLYVKIMPSFSHVEILGAALGNNAGMLGANYLALEAL
ncbi:MAG: ROK family protein [Lachnospiraceae bacterium]